MKPNRNTASGLAGVCESRSFEQKTIHFTDFEKHISSLQGEISAFMLPLFKAESLKFAASGREDKDVRMLGTGRPFVAQVHMHVDNTEAILTHHPLLCAYVLTDKFV